MENTTLIRVLGLVGVICVVAITAILIWYPGTTSEKLLAAGVIGGLITVIGGQLLNLKQSGDNAATLAVIAPKVDQAALQATKAATESKAAVAAVVENTHVTEDSRRELGEVKQVQVETHALVNGQTKEFKQALLELADQKIEMANQKTENAAQKAEIAALLEAAKSVLAVLAANTEGIETGRAQVVAEQAAHTAEPQADGSIVVEAPAVIQVVAP